MIHFIVITLSIYCLWLIVMIISWFRIKAVPYDSSSIIKMSVIVPFRNESENLPALISSFDHLNLQELSVEFLFVNDHSTDDFDSIFDGLKHGHKLIQLPEELSGKKAAINFGIQQSKGDVIITTDADCEVNPNWLRVIHNYFQDDSVNMAFGGVTFRSNGIFDKLQLIEFAPLIGTGAASLQLGQPFMCNAANLAFRKKAFNEVDGYEGNEHIASGDDEFLLAKFHQKLNGKILFINETDAVIKTSASGSINTFFNQRKRWSSKWSNNLTVYKLFLALLVFMAALSTLMGLFNLLINPSIYVAVALGTKVFLEGIFIASILHYLNSSFNIFYYLVVQLVYPFYVLIFGVVANIGGYSWKGRDY